MRSAYLILRCSKKDHSIQDVLIWSSDVMDQSRIHDLFESNYFYSILETKDETFDKARTQLINMINSEHNPYHYLSEYPIFKQAKKKLKVTTKFIGNSDLSISTYDWI